MGLSQDEIEKLMNETPATSASGADQKQTLLEGIASLYSQAVGNILPVITSSDSVDVKAEPPAKGKVGDLLQPLAEGNVFILFRLPALTESAIAGVIANPLALDISQRMMGQEGAEEMNDALLSALNEAFNNVLGAFDTALKDEFGVEVEHSDTKFLEGDPSEQLQAEAGMTADTEIWGIILPVTIDQTSGNMILLLTDACATELAGKHPSLKAAPTETAPAEEAASAPAGPAEAPAAAPTEAGEAPAARFEDLTPRATTGESKGIDLILDVPLSVAVELGRKKLSVKDILGLVPGSLVELDKLAGEPVDLLVNGKLFAKGEVVVIDENFGVRVSSIVTPKERIERMGG
jgi:flagellar motor switch protein FliN/FliY